MNICNAVSGAGMLARRQADERKPAAAERFGEYLSRYPTDDEPDDDDLRAELDRLLSAD